MGFKEFVALTIGLLHISLSSCQEFEVAEKQCVPYSSCSEISWLYQNGALQNEIDPNELTCGYENGNVHYFYLAQLIGHPILRIPNILFVYFLSIFPR